MEIKRNIFLKNYTSFKIGGPANYFVEAKNRKELALAVEWAKKRDLTFFILGGGSNLLVSDKGFGGMVIKIANCRLQIADSKIVAGAGVSLAKLANIAAGKGLSGLEWAAGIPGTLGGGVFGNCGAFGKSIGEIIKEVEVLNGNGRAMIMTGKECQFSYRSSVFKKKKHFIILSATISFEKGNKKEIKKKIKKYLAEKQKNQPLDFPSAGSVFINPSGIAAGKLIEECGLKGKTSGGAKISEKHANFILNFKNARAKDVKILINLAKREVKKRFKKNLTEEIKYLGF